MASKHSNQKKYAKAKFDSHQVTLTPYPPLSKIYGGVSKSMLTLNEAIIDVKKGSVHDKNR